MWISKSRDHYRSKSSDGSIDTQSGAGHKVFKCEIFKYDKKCNHLVNKTVNLGMIDSGCPEAVVGSEWIKVDESSFEVNPEIKYFEQDKRF